MKNLLRPTGVLGWYAYEFGTSALLVNGGLYFPKWLTSTTALSDVSLNVCFIVVTVVLLGTAPLLGSLADRAQRYRAALVWCAAGLLTGTLCIYVVDVSIRDGKLRGLMGLLGFSLVLYSFQLGTAFYNSLLKRVASAPLMRKVSGNSVAASWLGTIIGIMVVYPFVNGMVHPLPSGVNQSFLPAAFLFIIFACPALALLPPDPSRTAHSNPPILFLSLYSELWRDARSLLRVQRTRLFVVSFVLFMDAILTIQNNAPLYLSHALALSETAIAQLFVLLFVCIAIGGILSGRLTAIKSQAGLFWCICAWAVGLPAITFTTNVPTFAILFGVLGLFLGAAFNWFRVLFIQIIPEQKLGEHFGIYASFERVASILGPLIWSAALLSGKAYASDGYRLAMLGMSVLVVAATIVFRRLCSQNEGPLL